MSENSDEIAQVFWEACQLTSDEDQKTFLSRECGADRNLRRRVEKLLDARHRAEKFLEQPFGAVRPTVAAGSVHERPGTTIGRYDLIEQIGEGGMALVFLAEQREPVRRNVALKIIKPGMDTREVVARFETERQALALMDHPNIAKVLDGGSTSVRDQESGVSDEQSVDIGGGLTAAPGPLTPGEGRPYFVMELVDGIPITDYCDQNQLAIAERLELFASVCHAVQHAHQKGIIHRDLKPSNVMVTNQDSTPVPKIIDFGIAKATNRRLTEKTVFTHRGQMVGTPLYMSPEQAEMSGLDVDTRSDIYSLGAMLYEILTGSTPFDKEQLREAGFDEVRRMIREDDPPKPSTRTSTLGDTAGSVAAKRRIDPAKLVQLLRGELDWIVMKALEKDRARRYETANGLARDIQRYLDGELVEACPPSTAYRFRKFARRNRAALMTAVVVSLALVVGTGVAVWQAIRAERQRVVADTLRTRAESRETTLRQHLYTADMRLAHQAWKNGEIEWALERLQRHRPDPDQEDLRGFEWHYLWGLCHADLKTLKAHEGQVYCVAFSPDGHTLASVGQDGKVGLWAVQTGRLRTTLEGHLGEVNCVAFSPDGLTLGTAADDGTVKLWETASGRLIATLEGHTGDVNSVVFSADGQLLASGGSDNTARLWDVESFQQQATFVGHTGDVRSVAISPDGKTLATASADDTLRLWDTATGQSTGTLRGHTNSVFCVVFSHDGQKLATASADRTLKLWQVDSGQMLMTLSGHTDWVQSAAFSPNDVRLASAGKDGTVRLWNTTTGEVENIIRGHIGRVRWAAFSGQGDRLATAGGDGTVRLWDLSGPQGCRAGPIPGTVLVGIAFAPDGRLLTIPYLDSQLCLWDLETGLLRKTFGHSEPSTRRAVFTPDGNTLVTCETNGTIRLWDVNSGGAKTLSGFGHLGGVKALAMSTDGTLASGGGDGTVKLWDLSTRRELTMWHAHEDELGSLAFSPDAQALATASAAGAALWDPATGRRVADLIGHEGAVSSLAFAPDGAVLATAGTDRTIRLWESGTGRLLATLVGHADHVGCVAFSPDGKTLASGSQDCTVRLWSRATGHELLMLEAHTGEVDCVAFSPDGKILATEGESDDQSDGEKGELYLWPAGQRSLHREN